MRRLLFFSLLFVCIGAITAFAQPLVIGDAYEVTGFLSPTVSYSGIMGQPAFTLGASAGMIIDHSMVIGLEGKGLFAGVRGPVEADGIRPDLQMFSGALLLERIEQPNDRFHLVLRASIGGGYLRYSNPGDKRTVTPDKQDAFALVEPGIGVEYNAADNMRIELSGQYRFLRGIDLEGLDGRDAESFVVQMMIKLGSF